MQADIMHDKSNIYILIWILLMLETIKRTPSNQSRILNVLQIMVLQCWFNFVHTCINSYLFSTLYRKWILYTVCTIKDKNFFGWRYCQTYVTDETFEDISCGKLSHYHILLLYRARTAYKIPIMYGELIYYTFLLALL